MLYTVFAPAMKTMQLTRPPLLVDLIIEKLEQAIINGDLPPATRLTEEGLSKDLKTSRTPVREALFKLEQMGFVVRRDTGGWDVRSMDIGKFLERYEIKVMVEIYSLLRSTAATRSAFLAASAPVWSRMKKAATALDYESYRELDLEFHRNLLLLHCSDTMAALYEESLKHVLWVRKMTISPNLDIAESFRDHERLLGHIGKGAVSEAVRVLARHHERVISKVKEQASNGSPKGYPENSP
jgi:DNA-binding GntR family transcriptional regulator